MVGVIMRGEKGAGKEIFSIFIELLQPGLLSLMDPYINLVFQSHSGYLCKLHHIGFTFFKDGDATHMDHQVAFLQQVLTYQEFLGIIEIVIHIGTFGKKIGSDTPHQ